MKIPTTREAVLARSRAADARLQEKLKESDGAATYTPLEVKEEVTDELEQSADHEVTEIQDESGD